MEIKSEVKRRVKSEVKLMVGSTDLNNSTESMGRGCCCTVRVENSKNGGFRLGGGGR
ncbi:hypothetical protein DFA_01840 [Cavenderia fasciculata]|uniref:Uncharacterized protein n=1 Tax=Cavenderia fasciculata TaxID=261658 RepID=F4PV46_CACFS|nr:uncharacterized protein DFA_01840 [Cavenderia fasciculata]EGG21954.1 hypothetical protein DFA_01840 [Cavenderia fasciculata]|eukprot:XP_004359805.1 hypothetical protein DFA_01840 [Cavenderia fasciculata]